MLTGITRKDGADVDKDSGPPSEDLMKLYRRDIKYFDTLVYRDGFCSVLFRSTLQWITIVSTS